jgi:argininosuccinate lyase
MISTATWNAERMQAAADSEVNSATDLAEWLVQRGTPFRDAHALVGKLVRRHLAGEGSLKALAEADPALGPDAAALVAPGVAVQRRTTAGGAGPAAVAVQLTRFKSKVIELREAVAKYVR